MRKRSWIAIAITGAALIITLLMSNQPKAANPEMDNSTACCKVKMQECPEKQKTNAPGEMIMETLSRQFLHISPF